MIRRRRDEPEYFFTAAELDAASVKWRKPEAERLARVEAERAAGRARFAEIYDQAVRDRVSDERFARRGLS